MITAGRGHDVECWRDDLETRASSTRSDATTPACAAGCTGCPASTRSARTPAPPCLGTRSIKTTLARRGRSTSRSAWSTSRRSRAPTPRARSARSCAKARRPDPRTPTCPQVAALCVYNDLVGEAVEHLAGTAIKVAAVETAFPSGRASLAVKVTDTRDAVEAGADEIDMVIDRGAFLAGRYAQGLRRDRRRQEVCEGRPRGRPAHLKVILETGELVTYDNVRRASWLAMLAGADFVKTAPARSPPPPPCR